MALIAHEFHLSPAQVAEELDSDPERIALECIEFLRYAEAKAALDRNDDMKPWKKSQVMEWVQRHTVSIHHEKVAQAKAEREAKKQRK